MEYIWACMKKRFRRVLLTALLTGTGIAAFQLVWLRKTWMITENNFYTAASLWLQKSVDEYHNQQIRTMLDQSMGAFRSATGSPEMHPIHEVLASMQQPDVVEQAVANIAGKVPRPPLNLNEVKTLYQKELKLHNTYLPATLASDTFINIKAPYMASAILNSNTRKIRITARFSNLTPYLLQQNTWPIAISFSLLLLTVGSLVYMLRVIRRQQQLDVMKNDFINNMTHELRTPVTILRSTHEAIDQFGYINNPERTLRYLQANRQVLDQMDKSIDRILQIARYENNPAVVPVRFHLPKLLTAIIESFSTNDQTTITLHYHLPSEEVYMDNNILETIISALIDNAVKYSERPAGIHVLVKPDTNANSMILEVKDNGIGIDAAHLPYIFDRFYRVPTGNIHNVKGYGIGLNYVQLLTHLLGGEVTVKSKPGAGTTFRLLFPYLPLPVC